MSCFNDGTITIRSMKEEDSQIIYQELLNQNWHPSIKTYENYYREQELNQRVIFKAEYDGNVAGLTTLGHAGNLVSRGNNNENKN